MDELIGRTVRKIPRDSLLLVVSDHGFKAFERGVNLNTWLHQQGYLTLKEGTASGDWFQDVDWSRTQAYSLGLNGIYLNLKGRESRGTVEPGREAAASRVGMGSALHLTGRPPPLLNSIFAPRDSLNVRK